MLLPTLFGFLPILSGVGWEVADDQISVFLFCNKAPRSLYSLSSPSGIPHTWLIIPTICSKTSFFLCAPLKSINLLFWLRSITIVFKFLFNSLKASVFPVKLSRDNLLNTLPSSSKSFPFHFAKVAKIVVPGFLGSFCEKKLITSLVSSSSVFPDTSTCFHSAPFWGACSLWRGCLSKRGVAAVSLRHAMASILSFCNTIPSFKSLFWKIPIWISFWSGS